MRIKINKKVGENKKPKTIEKTLSVNEFLEIIEKNLIKQIEKIMLETGKVITEEEAKNLLSRVGLNILEKSLKIEYV